MFMTLTILPWYTGVLLALAEFFGMHHVRRILFSNQSQAYLTRPLQIVTRVLLNNNTYTDSVNQTPYFAGIIFGSMIWVLFCWFTRLVGRMSSHPLRNFG